MVKYFPYILESLKSKEAITENHGIFSKVLTIILLINLISISGGEYFFLKSGQVCANPVKLGALETTPVQVVAEWPVDKYTQEGEHFIARVVEDVILDNGEVLIPKNSKVKGHITNITNEKSFRRAGRVDIEFKEIVFPDNINSIKILADGSLVEDKHKLLKAVGQGSVKVLGGAALGAIIGFRFAGVLGSSLSGSNLMIAAGTGAGLALVSFISENGKELKIEPGLPMTLSLMNMENKTCTEQAMPPADTKVSVKILNKSRDKLKLQIENKNNKALRLANLKVVDNLGYVKHAIKTFSYFDRRDIPANSIQEYIVDLPSKGIDTGRWLVLTDSFDKEEYFRVKI
jgi:hypothetical protein